eukprot:scaffold650843_cov45-Prasinocladus_malaysianus.AAC.1
MPPPHLNPGPLGPEVELAGQQLLVVGAAVEHHGEALLGPEAPAGHVEGHLAHADADAVGTQVTQAEDAPA